MNNDTESMTELELRWHYKLDASIQAVSLNETGRRLVVSSEDGFIHYFNSRGKLLWRWRMKGLMRSISVGGYMGEYICSGSVDKNLYFFNYCGKLLWKFRTDNSIWSVAMSRDAEYVACGTMGRYLYLLDGKGKMLWKQKVGECIWSVGITADAGHIVCGTDDGYLYFFNRKGDMVWTYPTHGAVWGLDISCEDGYVAAGSDDGCLYIIDFSGDLINRINLKNRVRNVSFGMKGRYISASSDQNHMLFFNNAGQKILSHKMSWPITNAAISDTGNSLAVTSKDYFYFFDTASVGDLYRSVDQLMDQAKFYLESGDYELAYGNCLKVMKHIPGYPPAERLKDKIRKLLEKELDQTVYKLPEILIVQKKYKEAVNVCSDLLGKTWINPGRIKAFYHEILKGDPDNKDAAEALKLMGEG